MTTFHFLNHMMVLYPQYKLWHKIAKSEEPNLFSYEIGLAIRFSLYILVKALFIATAIDTLNFAYSFIIKDYLVHILNVVDIYAIVSSLRSLKHFRDWSLNRRMIMASTGVFISDFVTKYAFSIHRLAMQPHFDVSAIIVSIEANAYYPMTIAKVFVVYSFWVFDKPGRKSNETNVLVYVLISLMTFDTFFFRVIEGAFRGRVAVVLTTKLLFIFGCVCSSYLLRVKSEIK